VDAGPLGGRCFFAISGVQHPIWAFLFVSFLLALAWLGRPRLGDAPTAGVVTRGEAPTLYGLCDDVARSYGCRPPSYIVIDSGFGAASGSVGWRGRSVIRVGLPLVATLAPQTRVALVASQLAPQTRRGPQGLFIRTAMGTLDEWCRVLAPEERSSSWRSSLVPYRRSGSTLGGAMYISTPIANAIMWILGRPAVWLLRLETRLVSRDAELSAFRADRQASEVAGSAAMIELYGRLALRRRFRGIVQQEARAGRDGLLARVTEAVNAAQPAGGGEAPTGQSAAGEPAAAERIRRLQQGPSAASVVLDSGRSAAIDRELEIRARTVEDDLYEWYRSSIYR